MSSTLNKVQNVFDRSGSVKKSKKETANLDLQNGRPMDLLVARGDQWKAIVKGLTHYYDGIAKAERHEGKEVEKHAGDLPLPFAAGAQFEQEGRGWEPTLYEIRNHTRTIADLHEGLAKKVESTVVAELDSIKAQIKTHLSTMHEDGLKKADVVDKERLSSTDALSKLGHSIATVGQQRQQNPTAVEDPYIAHSIVERQLAVQVQRENELQSSTLRHQSDTERLEKEWSDRIKKACAAYAETQAEYSEKIRSENAAIAKLTAAVTPEGEWAALTGSDSNYLIPTDAPIRDVNQITFPSQGHEAAQSIKTGNLERKTKFTKKYEEVFVVLTSSGFLHAYDKDPTTISRSDDPKSIGHPTLSLYLPNCSLGAHAPASSSKHKFGISGIKSSNEKNSRFKLGGKKDKDFTFRARSQAEMIAWHTAIAKLSGQTQSVDSTASTATQHKGAVPSTVADVGLAQEGEEEEEEDDSDEEEEEAFVEAPAGTAATTSNEHALPVYSGEGVTVPAEKKLPLDGSEHAAGTGATASGSSSLLNSYPLSAPIAGETYGAPTHDHTSATTSSSVHVPEGSTAHVSVPSTHETGESAQTAAHREEETHPIEHKPSASLVEPEAVVAQGSSLTV